MYAREKERERERERERKRERDVVTDLQAMLPFFAEHRYHGPTHHTTFMMKTAATVPHYISMEEFGYSFLC